ncbi:MAG: AAA family ATPase [Phycisphaerae bacterium]|nr:AAA family ATPase [Phycisphaerae bacterium]
MDLSEYLKTKQQDLKKNAERIQNFKIFDFNYIPNKPLMREEVKPLIDSLLRYNQTGIANNVVILGARGCGKSLSAKYLIQALAQQTDLNFVYVNCRQHNTSFKIIAHILDVRPRGVSLDELWQKFEVGNKDKTVFILDEIDLMSDKDRHKDILYLISRSPNNYMTILLSNNPKFLNSLDESINSTLQPEIIHFSSYKGIEMQKILTERARMGLKSEPAGTINTIAAMTVSNTNSDVRVGIKTLYLWALEPKVFLKEHFEKARRDIMLDVVRDLNDKNLLILKAALSQQDGYVKDIYQAYRRISTQFNEEPFSYVHFYSNLSYLQSIGLILLISTKVSKTYTNRIQLTFDPSILTTIWQTRFG